AISVVVPWIYRPYGTDQKTNMKISKEVFDKYFELKKERSESKKDTSKVEQPINNKEAAAKAQSEQTEN
ncbi:hypothetical protein AB1D90_002780, partial [Listeria monocytogenes]